ncbi:MAG: S9 family peptidase, partial [Gammaproteobacteria bacterium]
MTHPKHRFSVPADATAPLTEKRPVEITLHGERRTDPYAWLRDPNWQEVLRDPGRLQPDIRRHLEEENTWYERATAELAGLRATLVTEMRGRIREDDSSVPLPDGAYAYAVRYREGGQYPVFVRTARDDSERGEETIVYDGDAEGEGEEFFDIGAVEHSPDHRLIAYGVDRTGSEYYDIRVRNVASGEEYPETIHSTDGDAVWAADSASFYYIERDDHQRPKRVKHHVLGTDPAL